MQKNRLYKILNVVISALIVLVVFFVAKPIFAQSPELGLDSLQAGGLNLVGGDIRVIIGRVVQVFLSIIGIVFVILIIYSGWLWMSSVGEADKIGKAKKTITSSVIGLAIILSSFGITQFIISGLQKAIFNSGGGSIAGSISPGLVGSLGAGVIGNHVPARGQTVPRNTKIAIIFKAPMDEKLIINDTNNNGVFGDIGDEANKASIKLIPTNLLVQNNNSFNGIQDTDLVTLLGAFTADKKSFVFNPQELLGNVNETVSYTAFLTANMKKADGGNAFVGSFSNGYMWEFNVEPNIDNVPPTIINVIPSQGINPRNTVVQINFSEALDPISSSGDYDASGGFQNITIKQGANILTGSYKISNSFKTIEFVTDSLCGVNSCGGDVYCLPADAIGTDALVALVKSATVSNSPPASAGFPYDGIVDLAGNSLDGNGDRVSEGSESQSSKVPYQWIGGNRGLQGDDVTWQFSTTNEIDLVPPVIESVTPGVNSSNISADIPVEIRFSKLMSTYTLNNENIVINHNVTDPNYSFWWYVDAEALDGNNTLVTKATTPIKTKAIIKHANFYPSPNPPASQSMFYPGIKSEIQDLRQNCFVPSAGPACVPTTAKPYCCNGVSSATKCSYLP